MKRGSSGSGGRGRRKAVAGPGTYLCPHCNESVDTAPDPGGGLTQDYIEDCAVCCRPNRIVATFDPDTNEFSVEASGDV